MVPLILQAFAKKLYAKITIALQGKQTSHSQNCKNCKLCTSSFKGSCKALFGYTWCSSISITFPAEIKKDKIIFLILPLHPKLHLQPFSWDNITFLVISKPCKPCTSTNRSISQSKAFETVSNTQIFKTLARYFTHYWKTPSRWLQNNIQLYQHTIQLLYICVHLGKYSNVTVLYKNIEAML